MEQTPPWEKCESNTADARKRKRAEDMNEKLLEAVEDDKTRTAFLQEMQDKFDKDRELLRAELDALIENESMRPAIEAIMKHGMCECAGAHGNMCAWVLLTWFAAEAFRVEHGAEASSVLASMSDDAISSYLVDARVEIKVLRHLLDSLIYAQASRSKKIPELGDAAAHLEEVFMNVPWPPPADPFDEKQYRSRSIRDGLGSGQRAWSGSSRTQKLDYKVMKECGTSPDDLRKLDEDTKINMLVDKQRQKYVTPLEKISGDIETFKALVLHPISMDELSQVVKTIVFFAHGDSLLTNEHCAVADTRLLLRMRQEYLEAEAKGEIGNPEHFYSAGNRCGERDSKTGKKLTRFLMNEPDLPECAKVSRGRFSLIGEGDAKVDANSLLTATEVSSCVVLLGAVKDVNNTEEAAAGRIVVTCLIEGEPWHVLGTPAHFAMLNPFTRHCLMKLASIFAPTLALGYRQDPSLAPPVKMVKSGDGGIVVGDCADTVIKAHVKSAFPKTVEQLDRVVAKAVTVIGESKISNASAHLLAARVVSASLSGALESLEYRGLGLGTGYGVDVDSLTKLIDSMKDVVDISKAVGPLGHILCSCPTPDPPPPAPAPAPRPTNVNDTDPRNGWADDEWDQFAQQHG
jgi:hypothetical protein